MTIWIKKGVCGQLQPICQKGFGRVVREIEAIGEDTFVTSIQEGNHMAGSFHDIGMAFDIDYPKNFNKAMEQRLIEAAGPGFQFIWHTTHIHCEYDI